MYDTDLLNSNKCLAVSFLRFFDVCQKVNSYIVSNNHIIIYCISPLTWIELYLILIERTTILTMKLKFKKC